MFIVDRELEQLQRAGTPIRVGMVGAGFMARGIARQMLLYTKGMQLVAISNRHLDGARAAYAESGENDVAHVHSAAELDDCIARGRRAITDDPMLLCDANGIDVILEVTGTIEFAAQVVMQAIARRKHVVMMNAELDGTLGPILKVYADREGVVITNTEGDQPGVILNLYRWVKGLGIRPVLCGNIKGLHDPYRNPTTQEGFAKKWGMKAPMVTSFADGTKISFENAIVANAVGMRVAKRGMHGPVVAPGTPIQESVNWYPLDELLEGPGIVDYCVGAMPNPGIFVLGTTDDATERHYLSLYKMGPGPLYCFYWPYHLCHFEVPFTVARAAIFGDADDHAARCAERRRGRRRQERPKGRGDRGRSRALHDLWAVRERGDRPRRASSSDRPRRRLPPSARRRQGSGARIRRCRGSVRKAVR